MPMPTRRLYERVLHTQAGWTLILFGCATGAVFAVLSLAVFFISFPLVLDRPITASHAIAISVRAMLHNPFMVFAWGAVVVLGAGTWGDPGAAGNCDRAADAGACQLAFIPRIVV